MVTQIAFLPTKLDALHMLQVFEKKSTIKYIPIGYVGLKVHTVNILSYNFLKIYFFLNISLRINVFLTSWETTVVRRNTNKAYYYIPEKSPYTLPLKRSCNKFLH